MKITTAHSSLDGASQAAQDLRKQIGSGDPKALLFFASPKYDPKALAKAVKDAFPRSLTFGCTTAGEIVSGKMLKNAVVAMGLGDEILEGAAAAVVDDVSSKQDVDKALARLEAHFKEKRGAMDYKKYAGLILVDGLCGQEESIMDHLGDLTDLAFVGGSAADDLRFAATHVFSDGQAKPRGAVLVLLKPKVKFSVLKTQSFRALDKKLVATKVDEPSRTVIEFNGRPAADAYAAALGVTVEEAPKHFMHNPVGLMINGDPYVRSPQRIKGHEMVFYCNIKKGTELSVLESGDIVKDTRKDLEAKKRELGGLSGVINFHCILRTLELEKQKKTAPYGKLFADVPTVGFSTYGEEYLGHINQTSTMLVFR